MAYRWKAQIEAVQLPGDLSEVRGEDESGAKKGGWLMFENGVYQGYLTDEQFREKVEPARAHRASKPAPVEEKPKRGRPRGMKPLLVTDGETPPLDQTEAPVGN
mgnify:CR=1 FL=1